MRRWTRWIGNHPHGDIEQAVMFSRRMLSVRGRKLELHRFVRADVEGCYHGHDSTAVRIILAGGYMEEVCDPSIPGRHFLTWRPGDFGIVRPGFVHRIHSLYGDDSYSLWIRGPVTHELLCYGPFCDEVFALSENHERVGDGWRLKR